MASWFSKVLKAAKDFVVEQGEDYKFVQLGEKNGVTDPSESIERDLDYVTVTLRSSRIVAIRKGTGKFYASVQSTARYLSNRVGDVEYQKVIVPEMREMDADNVDHVLVVDKPIVGPVPYISDFTLELGLFSVKAADLAGPYLELLTSLAQPTFLSSALAFVDPLKKGADLLFGNNKQSTLEIGLEKTWPGGQLKTGTWLLMRAPKGEKGLDDLQLDPNDGKVTNKAKEPFKDYPYLVFSISRSQRRDDWAKIPELKGAWDAIGEASKKGRDKDAEQLLREFQRKATWSPDLVPADAKRLVARANELLGSLQPEHVIAFAKGRTFPAIDELDLYDDIRRANSSN